MRNDQYVDGDGVVFANNYFAQPNLQIVDETGIRVSSDQLVASNRFLGFIGRVLASANQQACQLKKSRCPLATTRQVEVILQGSPTKLQSIGRSLGRAAGRGHMANKVLSQHGITPSTLMFGFKIKRFINRAYHCTNLSSNYVLFII